MAGGLIDFTGKDLPKGATVGTPLTDFTGKDLPAGARVGMAPPAPNAVQQVAGKVMSGAQQAEQAPYGSIGAGGLGVLKMLAGPLTQHTDPSGKGQPLPMGVAAAEDIGGGVAQALGGSAGEAAGPLGAMAGAGAANVAANRLIGHINQHFYGWDNNPSLLNDAGSFALGAGLEAIPAGRTALAERSGVKMAKGAAEMGEKAATEDIAKNVVPKAAEAYRTGSEHAILDHQQAVSKAVVEAQQNAIKEIAPHAVQDQLGRLTGVTPEEAAAIDDKATQDFAMQRGVQRQAVFEPERRIYGEDLQPKFKAIYDPHAAKPAGDTSGIVNAITDERDYLGKYPSGPVSKPLRDIMDRLDPQGADPLTRQFSEQARKEMTGGEAEATRAALKKLPSGVQEDSYREAGPRERVTYPEGRALGKRPGESFTGAPFAGQEKGPSQTIGDLLGAKQQLDDIVSKSTGTVTGTAAANVRDAINEHLLNSGIMVPRELREQYGLYKSLFDKPFRRKIATSAYPTDYGKDLFGDPQRFQWLYGKAKPEEQGALKTLFGQWAQKQIGENPAKFAEQVSPGTLRQMFGSGEAGKMRNWLTVDPQMTNWQQFISGLPPEMQQRAVASAREGAAPVIAQAIDKNNRVMRDLGKKIATMLGPAGRRAGERIRTAATPEAARRIAEEEFGQAFYDTPLQAPPASEKAEFDAYMNSKALTKGVDMDAARKAGAIEYLRKLAKSGDPTLGQFRRRMAYVGPMGASSAIMGGGASFSVVRAVESLVGMMLLKPRDAFIRSLDSDESASAFMQALKAKPNSLNIKNYSGKMGESAAHWALRQAMRIATKSAATAAQQSSGLGAGTPPEGEEE